MSSQNYHHHQQQQQSQPQHFYRYPVVYSTMTNTSCGGTSERSQTRSMNSHHHQQYHQQQPYHQIQQQQQPQQPHQKQPISQPLPPPPPPPPPACSQLPRVLNIANNALKYFPKSASLAQMINTATAASPTMTMTTTTNTTATATPVTVAATPTTPLIGYAGSSAHPIPVAAAPISKNHHLNNLNRHYHQMTPQQQQQQQRANSTHSNLVASSVTGFVSGVEQAILRAHVPIEITDSDEITVNGERGIYANKQEVASWKGKQTITFVLVLGSLLFAKTNMKRLF